MYYVFRRSVDEYYPDYIADFETMELTEDPDYAAQVSDLYIDMLDTAYLNSLGFYAVSLGHLTVNIVSPRYFRPRIRNYRSHMTPRQPRRRQEIGPHGVTMNRVQDSGPHIAGEQPGMVGTRRQAAVKSRQPANNDVRIAGEPSMQNNSRQPQGAGRQESGQVHVSRAERRGNLTNNMARGGSGIHGGQMGHGGGGRSSSGHTGGRGGQRGI